MTKGQARELVMARGDMTLEDRTCEAGVCAPGDKCDARGYSLIVTR